MSPLAFELTPALEASEPPEARGLARDDVRLMVASRAGGEIIHARFRDLPSFIGAGDVLVINNSATLPAAVPGQLDRCTPIEVRFATAAPDAWSPDLYAVELRSASGGAPLRTGRIGVRIVLAGGARLELLAPYAGRGRLWLARVRTTEHLHQYLARHGRPISYGYVPERWPLSAYQTVYATTSGSAEMPSAGRPFTPELEPLASHLQMLEALAGEPLGRRCYASALEHRYLWHEFGDSHLILP